MKSSNPDYPFKPLLLFGLVCLAGWAQSSWGCSTVLPEPTLRQHFWKTDHVYMARLVAFKRTPIPGIADMKIGHFQDATFNVLMTLKGPPPKTDEIKTHTEYYNGNCTVDLMRPLEFIDKDGKEPPDPYSDIWILFFDGKEPYKMDSHPPNFPINAFNESDLRFLLSDSQHRAALGEREFVPGQVWSFRLAASEPDATLTVLKVETLDKIGEVVHISVSAVRGPNGVTKIGHLPMSWNALDRSVLNRVAYDPAPPDLGGYSAWKRAKGGVFTYSVSDAMATVRQALEQRK